MLPQSFNLDQYPDYQKVAFLSGSVFISELLAAPFERVKVLLQTKPSTPIKSFLYRREVNAVIKSIGKKEGWKSLYHGFKPFYDREIFLNMSRFYGYYIGMDHIFKNKEHQFFYPDVIISCILGTSIATFFSQALDIKRLRIQAEDVGGEKTKKLDPIVKMRKVLEYRRSGRPILPGVGVNLAVQNIQSLTEVLVFFNIRNAIKNAFEIKSDYVTNGISVITASTLGSIISAPLDLIYSNIVFRRINQKDSSFWRCTSDLIKQDGVKGLYKSYIPYLYKTVVFNLSMITLLQLFCSTFKLPNKVEQDQIPAS